MNFFRLRSSFLSVRVIPGYQRYNKTGTKDHIEDDHCIRGIDGMEVL